MSDGTAEANGIKNAVTECNYRRFRLVRRDLNVVGMLCILVSKVSMNVGRSQWLSAKLMAISAGESRKKFRQHRKTPKITRVAMHK